MKSSRTHKKYNEVRDSSAILLSSACLVKLITICNYKFRAICTIIRVSYIGLDAGLIYYILISVRAEKRYSRDDEKWWHKREIVEITMNAMRVTNVWTMAHFTCHMYE